MQIITVANLKGGTTKTTTSAFLLHAAAERGLNVFGVDADAENQSLLRWADLAGWSIPVVGLPATTLHRKLSGISGDRDLIVIDTPPMESGRGVVTSALRAATHLVIPMSPTTMDFDRLQAVRDLVAEVEPLRDEPLKTAVLLTQVVTSAASGPVFSDLVAEAGVEVLSARVARLERYAQSFGEPITNADESSYGDALTEILEKDADR